MQTVNQNPRVESVNEKKPYEKPEILYRANLEAMAAVCQTPSQGGTGKNVLNDPAPGGGLCTSTFS